MSDEADVAALFALPPEEFVAARNSLAKQMRTAGDGEGARRVRALRRPTVPAWAVDRLARRHAEDVRLLLEAGCRLRQAQDQALSGQGGGNLRDATGRRRELVDRLTDRAAGILADAGREPGPHRAAIAATLEAATVDPEAAEALRSATLSKELAPPSGFGDVAPAAADVMPAPADVRAVSTSRDEDGAARRQAAEQALERARHGSRRAGQHVRDAEQDADDARREARAAAEEIERLEQRLADARRRAEGARRGLQEADAATEQARRDAQLRAAEEHDAQERLDGLG